MTFKPWNDATHLYFITATLLGWRPLLARPEFAHIVLDSLEWHRRHDRLRLYAFVIMPTHYHAILKPAESQTISAILQSLGSYTAHAFLKQLQQDNLLDELGYFAEHRQPDSTEQHQIWQPLQAKNIYSPEFLHEKLEYIHNNPVAKKWRLASTRSAYTYSSACYYDEARAACISVDDVREWLS